MLLSHCHQHGSTNQWKPCKINRVTREPRDIRVQASACLPASTHACMHVAWGQHRVHYVIFVYVYNRDGSWVCIQLAMVKLRKPQMSHRLTQLICMHDVQGHACLDFQCPPARSERQQQHALCNILFWLTFLQHCRENHNKRAAALCPCINMYGMNASYLRRYVHITHVTCCDRRQPAARNSLHCPKTNDNVRHTCIPNIRLA